MKGSGKLDTRDTWNFCLPPSFGLGITGQERIADVGSQRHPPGAIEQQAPLGIGQPDGEWPGLWPFGAAGDRSVRIGGHNHAPQIDGERCLRDKEVSRRMSSQSASSRKSWFDVSPDTSTISVDPGEIAANALKGKVVSVVR